MTDRRLAVLIASVAVLALLFAMDRGWLDDSNDNEREKSSNGNSRRLNSLPDAGRSSPPDGKPAPDGNSLANAAAKSQGIASEPDSINPIAQLSLDQLEATRTRPVFEKSRRPPEAKKVFKARPQEPEPPPPPQGPPSLRLVGLAASQDQWVAVLTRIGENASVRLKEGETIDGWRLEVVSSTGVVVSKEGVDYPLTLFSR